MNNKKAYPPINIDYAGKSYQPGQLFLPSKYEMIVGGEITLSIKLEPEHHRRIEFYEFWETFSTLSPGQSLGVTVYGTQYHALHICSVAKVVSSEARNGIESTLFLDWTVNLIK
jgi:hypothetical protein